MSTAPIAFVIDDNRMIANSVIKMLQMLGYEAQVAYGALPAMQLLAQSAPDLILVDIHMQGINGVEVVRYIRRNQHTARVPIVAISSDTQGELVQSMKSAGANAFCPKPIEFETLERAIHDAQQNVALTKPFTGTLPAI
jgi:CheY-like chemotaxis protein